MCPLPREEMTLTPMDYTVSEYGETWLEPPSLWSPNIVPETARLYLPLN